MRPVPLLAFATAALGLAAWGGADALRSRGEARRQLPAADARPTVAVPADEALNARVARLERELLDLQRWRTTAAAELARCAIDPSGAPPVLASEASALAEPEPIAAPVDLAAEFERQGSAPVAPQAEHDLASRIGELLPQDARLDQIECRGAMCRVETTHRGMLRYREFVTAAFADPKTRVWTGTMQVRQLSDLETLDADGEIAVVAYLAPETVSVGQPATR